MSLRVVVEVAPKRSFASALDWPGWSRSGKTPDEAVAALVEYRARYAAVARGAKLAFAPPADPDGVEIVERLKGGATTEFGAPGEPAASEDEPLEGKDLERHLALMRAAWATFDAAANAAAGVELRKGPRGGGRDVPKIAEHVAGAEGGYLNKLGSKVPKAASQSDLRNLIVEVVTARATDAPLADPNKVTKLWSPRYAVRRIAWHALDHAWEIEDRSH